MGIIASCCSGNDEENERFAPNPDPEVRRQQQLAAAENRMAANQNRGILNPDSVTRLEKKAQRRDQLMEEAQSKNIGGGELLRWQTS